MKLVNTARWREARESLQQQRQGAAEKAHDQLIIDLEIKGVAVSTAITVRQLVGSFLEYKESSGTIEPSTVRVGRPTPWE